MSEPRKRRSVLLTTEGTYPYHKGGVSTWCHALTGQLSEVDFTLFAVAMHPYLERAYELTPNVRNVITVPLWGTEDPAEYRVVPSRRATFSEAAGKRPAPWSFDGSCRSTSAS